MPFSRDGENIGKVRGFIVTWNKMSEIMCVIQVFVAQ